MKCPKCGEEMEPGYLRVWFSGAINAGPKWYKEGEKPGLLSSGGDEFPYAIADATEIDGFLCRECVTLVLNWPKPATDEDTPPWPFINYS